MRAGREKPGVCGQQEPRSTIGHFIFLGLNSRSGRSAFAGDAPPGPAVPLLVFSRVLLCVLIRGFESACVLGPFPQPRHRRKHRRIPRGSRLGENERDRRKHQTRKSEAAGASVAEEPNSLSVQKWTPAAEDLGRSESLALESSSHFPVLVRRM